MGLAVFYWNTLWGQGWWAPPSLFPLPMLPSIITSWKGPFTCAAAPVIADTAQGASLDCLMLGGGAGELELSFHGALIIGVT